MNIPDNINLSLDDAAIIAAHKALNELIDSSNSLTFDTASLDTLIDSATDTVADTFTKKFKQEFKNAITKDLNKQIDL